MTAINGTNQTRWHRAALSDDDLAGLDKAAKTIAKPGVRLGLDSQLRAALRPVDDYIQQDDPNMVPVRAVAFDKTPQTNWALPWHQDRVIAVRERHDVDGFTNWSRKGDVWHCEPPDWFLNQMLFVRVHLDPCDAASGAMEIARDSHKAGLVRADKAADIANTYDSHICTADRGDILVLPMLTLHRSLPAQNPATRRVLRVDYAATDLPAPLGWAN